MKFSIKKKLFITGVYSNYNNQLFTGRIKLEDRSHNDGYCPQIILSALWAKVTHRHPQLRTQANCPDSRSYYRGDRYYDHKSLLITETTLLWKT